LLTLQVSDPAVTRMLHIEVLEYVISRLINFTNFLQRSPDPTTLAAHTCNDNTLMSAVKVLDISLCLTYA